MKLFKLLIPVFVIGLSFTSCKQKDYTCVCVDDKICGTPYMVSEFKGKSKQQAKVQCDTYDSYHAELDMTTNCEIEAVN